MPFEALNLREELSVHNIVTIHYFEYMNTFDFPGESHDFWELVCVDLGGGRIMEEVVPGGGLGGGWVCVAAGRCLGPNS